MRLGSGLRRPRQQIRASDLAGEVTAVGANVQRFQPGDEVFGEAGAVFAEFAAASAGGYGVHSEASPISHREMADAMYHFQLGHNRGKTVVVI